MLASCGGWLAALQQHHPGGAIMSDPAKMPAQGKNQGEGDREAARRYNEDQRQFVQSGKVDAAAEQAKGQDPAEAAAAEQAGKARAKEFDPEEARDYRKPDKG
jgi:hypothetical protein